MGQRFFSISVCVFWSNIHQYRKTICEIWLVIIFFSLAFCFVCYFRNLVYPLLDFCESLDVGLGGWWILGYVVGFGYFVGCVTASLLGRK